MFQHAASKGRLPQTLYRANISLILKKDRDELEAASYRPVSLIPNETKLISRILANRLKTHIHTIIHTDQTGFIPNRHIYFNLRRLFNILYAKHSTETVIISVDAQKAFDQVEWSYMYETLNAFGFGKAFVDWIRILYAYPTASVITNQDSSAEFPLLRGTRQGDPSSPFLFDLVIETLAVKIRQHPRMSKHHLSLYADDILLFVSNPEDSIPSIMEVFNHFGSLSGFQINWEKSELMPVHLNHNSTSLRSVPFRITKDRFTYLGVSVTRKPGLLLEENWNLKINQLKKNIEVWNTLPLSLVGRVNAIKMVVLPCFLYIFQSIPSFIPQKYFRKLDSIVTPFLWQNKVARINKKHLCKPKQEGGFGLPDFKCFYWAAHLNTLIFWGCSNLTEDTNNSSPAWLSLEQATCEGSSLPALLNSPIKMNKSLYNGNFVIHNSIKIWSQNSSHLKVPKMYRDAPIHNNHAFKPATEDPVFGLWREKGVRTLSDLYRGGT